MHVFLASVLLSFLPLSYRRWWRHEESAEMARATVVSGFLEAMISVLFLTAGFVDYTSQAWIPRLAWLEYALLPSSLLLEYLVLEGSIRFIIAIASGESLGSFPLYLFVWAQRLREHRRAGASLSPKVIDRVENGDGTEFDLRIASCRPKPNWDHLMTVSYKDELYEIAKQEEGSPRRRFVYLLRKMPEGKVVRGLHHYRPNEVFDPE